jgi:hypothetical protein
VLTITDVVVAAFAWTASSPLPDVPTASRLIAHPPTEERWPTAQPVAFAARRNAAPLTARSGGYGQIRHQVKPHECWSDHADRAREGASEISDRSRLLIVVVAPASVVKYQLDH